MRSRIQIVLVDRVLETDADDDSALESRRGALEMLGRYEDALRTWRKLGELRLERADVYAGLERAFRAAGRGGYWRFRRELDEGEQRFTWAAAECAQVGEADAAFVLLERAYRERDPELRFLLSDPWLRPLRLDPRFGELARRMKLPPPER